MFSDNWKSVNAFAACGVTVVIACVFAYFANEPVDSKPVESKANSEPYRFGVRLTKRSTLPSQCPRRSRAQADLPSRSSASINSGMNASFIVPTASADHFSTSFGTVQYAMAVRYARSRYPAASRYFTLDG